MVHFSSVTREVLNHSEGAESLNIITSFSPFSSRDLLFQHLTALKHSGTRIIIWNLRHEGKSQRQQQQQQHLPNHPLQLTQMSSSSSSALGENDKIDEQAGEREGDVTTHEEEKEEERGECEFDFSDPCDIRIRDFSKGDAPAGRWGSHRHNLRDKHVNKLEVSLRTYCTYLYIEPHMKIHIRGKSNM